ncbi:MAG: hypothetical protein JOY80_08215 [Candidatus Dormibacteraeota bacterium]|nr:hypothetical protein [Candidatus Dormibacteraeota bacterium]
METSDRRGLPQGDNDGGATPILDRLLGISSESMSAPRTPLLDRLKRNREWQTPGEAALR